MITSTLLDGEIRDVQFNIAEHNDIDLIQATVWSDEYEEDGRRKWLSTGSVSIDEFIAQYMSAFNEADS